MSPGRHRRPGGPGFEVAALATSGAFALVPLVASSTPAIAETAVAQPDAGPMIHYTAAGASVERTGSPATELYRFADLAPALEPHSAITTRTLTAPRHAAEPATWSTEPAARPAAPAPPPPPVPAPRAPEPAGESYTVRTGDTLSSIAAARGASWQSLWAANRGSVAQPGKIVPGERLHLPAQRTDASATPKPTATKPSTTKPSTGGDHKQTRATAVPAARGPAKQLRIELTGYSFQDNTPAGSAEVSHPILHKDAGGQGTFADPITVAVPGSGSDMAWQPGTRFYLPSVKRYVIVEDSGASGASGGVDTHLDMWIDGEQGSRSATDACMDKVTGDVAAQLNPPAGLPVLAGPIFGRSCNIPGA
jgi:LysM repeat protein